MEQFCGVGPVCPEVEMDIGQGGCDIWYHGSNQWFSQLKEGSTITPWRALAEAFSHKPAVLSILDDGTIVHNGTASGYLYLLDEVIVPGRDVIPHPRSTMESGLEFLTTRPVHVRFIAHVDPPSEDFLEESRRRIQAFMEAMEAHPS